MPGHGHGAQQNNFTQINSSFNEQLMNQTNFGFNPARGTIVAPPGSNNKDGVILVEPQSLRERRELNTQKRNRTTDYKTLKIESPANGANVNMH